MDALDEIKQIPVDWANHIAQGGLWSIALTCVLLIAGIGIHVACGYSLAAMGVVAVAKKTFDYFDEHETLAVCAGKAVVTVLWPASLYLLTRG